MRSNLIIDPSNDKFKDECGVFGVYVNKPMDVASMTYYGLYALQHRGQESAGIAVANGETIDIHKGMGLITEAFSKDSLEKLKGNAAIGHVRYSTSGDTRIENAQPLLSKTKLGSIAMAHNGTLVNAEVERRAIEEAAKFAGARDVVLMEEPMAAAIGAGLPVGEPTGSMIVDIGGGTTEVAIISLGGIVTSKSLRVAGDELDQAIIAYIKKEFNLMIGERTAEQVKMELGSAYKVDDEVREMDIKGRDMITGLPKTVKVSEDQIREALKEPVYAIIESIKTTLEKTPPELAADIMEKGIMLAGGGALLRGLDSLINYETNMPVHIAESPLDCVVLGAGKALDNFDELSRTQRGQ